MENKTKLKHHPLEIPNQGIDISPKNIPFTKVITSIVKKVSKRILSGTFNFGTMQNPAILSQPQSHLKVISKELELIIHYIKKMVKEEDKLERMKLLTAGIIANWTYNIYESKGLGPLNPILGETFQSEMEDGTKIFMEYISFSPPTSYIQIVNKDFELDGKMSFKLKVGRTMLNATSKFLGNYTLKIQQDIYEFKWPNLKIIQLLTSPVGYLENNQTITDKINEIESVISFQHIKGYFKNSLSNEIKIQINQKGKEVSTGEGNYLQYVKINDKEYWNWEIEFEKWKEQIKILPSDSCLREEIDLINQKKFIEADKIIEQKELQFLKEISQRKKFKQNKQFQIIQIKQL